MRDKENSSDNKLIIGVAVMASGQGKRFGRNKLLEDAGGMKVIERALDLIDDELFEPEDVCVITRTEEIKKITESRGYDCILHNLPDKSDTVRLGTKALEYADGIMFLQSDQFLVEKESIKKLVELYSENPEKPARLCFGERMGTPAIFPPSLYEGLKNLTGDVGGGPLLKNREVSLVQIDNDYELMDADTPEELDKMIRILESEGC